jgi:hypothetical protein
MNSETERKVKSKSFPAKSLCREAFLLKNKALELKVPGLCQT